MNGHLVDSLPETGEALLPGEIVLRNVSKSFRKHTVVKKTYSTVKTSLLQRLRLRSRGEPSFVHALDDVSFRVRPGEALGVIGRNGSGKSTLLKLISGIYRTDTGSVQTKGRISALIELGAGFHPDFTGRENVYLGGIMYGLSKREINERFSDIVRYAELEDFIDDPVRTYSSGMYMRLGFSLAIHTDPDILLVDEVLAVGDAAFINRCKETISDFKRKGKTLLFVTHDLPSIARWCDDAIWMQGGRVRMSGEPRLIVDSYLQEVEEKEDSDLRQSNLELSREDALDPSSAETRRWGNGSVEIVEVLMLDASDKARWVFHEDEEVTIEVVYRINRVIDDLVFGIGIIRADGLEVHGTNTSIDDVEAPIPDVALNSDLENPLEGRYRYKIGRISLTDSSYFVDVAAHRSDGLAYDYQHRMHKFSVRAKAPRTGVYNPDHQWSFKANYPVLEEKELSKKKQGAQ